MQDALVTVTAQELGQVLPSVMFPATHDRASNALYYAADIELPRPGRWRLTIQVSSHLGQGTAAFDVDVAQGDSAESIRLWSAALGLPAHCRRGLAAPDPARDGTRRVAPESPGANLVVPIP